MKSICQLSTWNGWVKLKRYNNIHIDRCKFVLLFKSDRSSRVSVEFLY